MCTVEETTRQYELQALSSQINPISSTILWTLSSGWLNFRIVSSGSGDQVLGNLLRLTLNQGKDLISLSDEISHVASTSCPETTL